jgi:hypothetical protein
MAKGKEPAAKTKAFRYMQTRLNREGWRELTNLSTDQERSLQSMMIEAINDLLGKYKRPKVAAGPASERDE